MIGDHQAERTFPAAGSLPGTEPPASETSDGLAATDFAVNGLLLRLWTDVTSLPQRLALVLASDPRPAAGPADLAYTVVVEADGQWGVSQGDEYLHAGIPEAVLGWIERSIMGRALERLGDRWRLYAGAVAIDGRAVVLPAATGVGKSTLVAALLRDGAGYLSDECALLDADDRVHPFRTALCLRAGSRALLVPDAPGEPARRGDDPVRYLDMRPWPAETAEELPLGALIFLERSAAAEPALRPCPRADALLTLVAQTSAARQLGFPLIERIVALLDRVPAYTLTLTPDLDGCARLVRQALAAPPPTRTDED